MPVLCLKCGYSITDPICACCVTNEVRAWLYRAKIKKLVLERIQRELKLLSNNVELMNFVLIPSENFWKFSTMKCIRCKKDMHLLCLDCVNSQAIQIIKENLEDRSYVQNFQESFSMNAYDPRIKKEEGLLFI